MITGINTKEELQAAQRAELERAAKFSERAAKVRDLVSKLERRFEKFDRAATKAHNNAASINGAIGLIEQTGAEKAGILGMARVLLKEGTWYMPVWADPTDAKTLRLEPVVKESILKEAGA